MNQKSLSLGCSGFSWKSRDNRHFLGRTYDMFGTLEANRITVIAPGYKLNSAASGKGEQIELKYGLIGNAIHGSASPIFTDGINEHGLMGTLQNYPGCGFFNTAEGKGRRDLHPAFFVPYMLGLCASISELCEEIEHINLTDEPIFGAQMSVHYLFSDESGEAVIVEPDREGISVHRRTIGVMTNAPDYSWQHQNLRNYVAVSPLHTPPVTLLGETFSSFGNGTGGSFGLPGSFSSPDRFVRLAFAKDAAVAGADESDAVSRMFSIFSVVTVPDGMLRDGNDCEKTLCTAVMCAESRRYYFSPFQNRRISAYSLQNALEEMGGRELVRTYPLPVQPDFDYVV